MVVLLLLLLFASFFSAIHAWIRLRHFLHMFQLEGYKRKEFRSWLRSRIRTHILRGWDRLSLLIVLLTFLTPRLPGTSFLNGLLLFIWGMSFSHVYPYRGIRAKKPLVFTPRMRRLTVVAVIITLLPVAPGLWALLQAGITAGLPFYLLGWWVAIVGTPLWVILAAWMLQPVERAIQEGFKRKARRKLAQRPDLKIIAITGSYGKTSTKFIIAEILSLRYHVLPTPSSYNTPMGLCLVINEQLRPEHQVLVLEMGMRYPGDIQELCELVQPDIGVVTTVGLAHLETMGSIERIAEEKATLVRCLKPEGVAVLNADNSYVRQMASLAPGKVLTVSLEGQEATLTADRIRYGPDGTSFEVRLSSTGETHTFQTPLLGKHNVLNILLALAVGLEMGLRLRQMTHVVARLQPIPHRLQLRKAGEITIIDDAFNSNPVGARNAVDILSQFRTGRRILVTPGMIELGKRQEAENRAWGTYMADKVDWVLLIGPSQTRPIYEGLLEGGFPSERIRVFRSLFEAQEFLQSFLRPGDTVLYENDLPDQYHEAA